MATKKNKKKNNNHRKIVFLILFLICLLFLIAYILHKPIKNIYIIGNDILSDKEIIELSGLSDYPPIINTYLTNIGESLKQNSYIKNVTIKHHLFGKIYLEIEEYKPLAIYQNNLVLSSKNDVENDHNIDYVPYITNDISSVYSRFVDKFSLVDKDILLKISHIEYSPNEVDKERFILYMVDSNYVYITLSKIEKINKYNSIVSELEGKLGIIYLDSGDYVEIKTPNLTNDDEPTDDNSHSDLTDPESNSKNNSENSG